MRESKHGPRRCRVPVPALLLALLSLLPSCDAEARRKATEADVIHSVDVPSEWVLHREYETGNGGGGPVVVYRSPSSVPRMQDVVLPDGYRPLSVKPLDYGQWRDAGTFRGPTPDGEGECDLYFAIARGSQKMQILAACVLDGRAPPVLPEMRPETSP
jgi:hypothetical protein